MGLIVVPQSLTSFRAKMAFHSRSQWPEPGLSTILTCAGSLSAHFGADNTSKPVRCIVVNLVNAFVSHNKLQGFNYSM
jgi:hypothetical protein